MDPDIETFLEGFAAALVDGDFADAAEYLAPWVPEADPAQLRDSIRSKAAEVRAEFDDAEIGPLDGFELDDKPFDFEAVSDEVDLAPEMKPDAYRGWCRVALRADDGEWSLGDLWCAVITYDSGLSIGHLEVSDPE